MQQSRIKFGLFVAVWLLILNYLILTKARINNSLLNNISEPFSVFFTGNVTGTSVGNPFIILFILNVAIVVLFFMSYFNWEKNKVLMNKKG